MASSAIVKSPTARTAFGTVAERPDWRRIYAKSITHIPNGDGDLVTVTRETARLAAITMRLVNERTHATESYRAAERELFEVLDEVDNAIV